MYIPRPFAADDETSAALLRGMSVAQLVTATESGPMATMLPWLVDAQSSVLVAHMARPNPQWQTPWQGQALVIVEGPNGYVSPSWYASRAEHGRVVPTWNYVVTHVYGELVVHDDVAWVGDAVRRLTARHESHRPDPWSVTDAPSEYIDAQLRNLVGIEVRVERIEAAVKMSQGRSAADSSGVINGLVSDGNSAVAEWVRRSTG